MEYYDDNELIIKKKFEEKYEKQAIRTKFVLTLVFCILGGVFIFAGVLLGIIFLLMEDELLALCLSIPFIGCSFLMFIIAFASRFLPTKINYETVKKKIEKDGFYSTEILLLKITLLEAKCENLESRVNELEDKIKRI